MKFYLLPLLFLLSACATGDRFDTAREIAQDGAFLERRITAPPFTLTAFEKVELRASEANLYIEGDGYAWRSRTRPSLDPTPKKPVALKLAKEDNAQNVIYLARPCQYSNSVNTQTCPQKYWTSHRFAPEVIEAMDAALSQIKEDYSITGFHLIGFSGGANIATLLTERRKDVLSLRTVAGNLNHVLLHDIHGVSQMPQSLNALDISVKINHIPQHHFVGKEDKIITPEVTNSFISTSGTQNCINITTVQNVSHDKGWEKKWSELTRHPLHCENE